MLQREQIFSDLRHFTRHCYEIQTYGLPNLPTIPLRHIFEPCCTEIQRLINTLCFPPGCLNPPNGIFWTKLESESDKASPCSKPFFTGNASYICLPIQAVPQVSFKHIFIALVSYLVTSNSVRTLHKLPLKSVICWLEVKRQLMHSNLFSSNLTTVKHMIHSLPLTLESTQMFPNHFICIWS